MRARTTSCTSVLAALVVAAGCGGANPSPTATPTATTPEAGPPPVTATGPDGTVTMAPHGGCWRDGPGAPRVCGDPVWPACPDRSLPAVRAPAGAVLTFRLDVDPSALELRIGDGRVAIALRPGRVAQWRAAGPPGPLVLRAVVPGRGDPAWAACRTT